MLSEENKKKIEHELSARAGQIDKLILNYLPKEEGFEKQTASAMNYAVRAGGKRIRPLLMEETYRMFGGTEQERIAPFMAAIEMIHTYSLIHDDLPAMDDDDYRRGRLTVHKKFGESMGILAGDGLLNYAYEVASAEVVRLFSPEFEPEAAKRAAEAMLLLARKPGLYGMLGGQAVDVESEKTGTRNSLSVEKLDYIYTHKTGALMEAAMQIGAVLAGADRHAAELIEQAARFIGFAFQIQDDILDETSTSEKLGKPVHSDLKNGKTTYITLFGVEAAGKKVEEYTEEAQKLLRLAIPAGTVPEFLSGLVDYLVAREH